MSDTPQKKPESKFLRFSGLGVQMGITIGGFTWLGTYLDGRYQNKTPWWTLGLSLFGVIAALWFMIKEVIKMNKEKDEQ